MFKIKFLDTGEELEVTRAEQLGNTKVRVSSPEESQRIQEAALALGYVWVKTRNDYVRNLQKPHLYFSEDGMSCGDYVNFFEECEFREFVFLPSQPQQIQRGETAQRGEITPEALEAEGWEKDYEDSASKGFIKGLVRVDFVCGMLSEIRIGEQNISTDAFNSMSDLRTLDRLVNGVAIPSKTNN